MILAGIMGEEATWSESTSCMYKDVDVLGEQGEGSGCFVLIFWGVAQLAPMHFLCGESAAHR